MQLVRKDNSNGIRVVDISVDWNGDYNVIKRTTGLLGGTMTPQPDIELYSGKVNRSLEEQTELEFNSMLNDYMDKGYKLVSDYGVEFAHELTMQQIMQIRIGILSDTNGVAKHMLAKTAYDRRDKRFNSKHYSSFKIDGVRSSLRYNAATDTILTASRGGKQFSAAAKNITSNPILLEVFREMPNLVLDGELYIHGKPLSYISGITRLKQYNQLVHDELDFYAFDVISDNPFKDRLYMLNKVQEIIGNKAVISGNIGIIDKVRFVEHEDTYSYDDVLEMHNRAIDLGYEGLVLRDPDATYGYGSRDWRMIKIKMFQDDEFVIIGMTPGLRKEDMVFVLRAHNGKSFEAKPVGSRMLRESYSDNIDLYIGMKATIKFFGYTIYGVPNLPVLKYIRT